MSKIPPRPVRLARRFRRQLLGKMPRFAKKLAFSGNRHYCPICRSHVRRFLSFGLKQRSDALCPICESLERHRLDWLFFERRTNLFDGSPKRMLHVAPEPSMEPRLRAVPELERVTADLRPGRAMVEMDIADIRYPDLSFDIVYCSHVLEHVPNDGKALRELHRVLRDDGWAVIQVPYAGEKTLEDPSVIDREGRRRLFGKADHVRLYGRDFEDRLREAGFEVDVVSCEDIIDPEEALQLRVPPKRVVFSCSKRGADVSR